jgi:HD-GYP domain-containing protein (c-di-GMP phosphodiesterase class II)
MILKDHPHRNMARRLGMLGGDLLMLHAPLQTLDEGNLVSFLTRRLGENVLCLHRNTGWEQILAPQINRFASYAERSAAIRTAIQQVQSRPQAIQLNELFSLALVWEPTLGCTVSDIQAGPANLTRTALVCALEAWSAKAKYKQERKSLQTAVKEMEHSRQENQWLRSFAHSLGNFNRADSANMIAHGIFDPLRGLLGAEDLFLFVDPEESERSGLQSCRFGSSPTRWKQVQSAVSELRGRPGASIICNATAPNQDGIRSLAGISVSIDDQVLGYLVAINRIENTRDSQQDSEFNARDVQLMEEAAMLLSRQTKNIHMVVDSHHLVLGTLHAMSSAIDARDPYTQGHSERVAKLAFELAKIWGVSEAACQEIYLSGLLHDLGKIGVPDHVLHKSGPLSDEEFAIIKQHPEIGHRIIERLGKLHFVLPGVLFHHERWDGRGYPHGLQKESIPLMARILAVADSFDAMTSSRPYRGAMQIERAAEILRSGANQQWDESIVDCFDIWLKRTLPLHPSSATLRAEDLFAQGSSYESLSQALTALNL